MREYFIWLAKFLTTVFVVCFIVPLFLFGVLGGVASTLQHEQPATSSSKKVAVIKVGGIIESSQEILKELKLQAENDEVQGIVLRIDSPGGAVGPSQDIYTAVQKFRKKKPIIASMGTLAASGGLYAAIGASKVFAQPGTLTGSIGVVMQLPNVKTLADKLGFDMYTVTSGKFKDVGNMFREMRPDEKDFLQNSVDRAYKDFFEAVVSARGLEASRVREFADGRVILGSQAKEWGLVDEMGDVFDASRAVFDELGEPLPEGEYPELYYPEEGIPPFLRDLLHKMNAWLVAKPEGMRLMYVM